MTRRIIAVLLVTSTLALVHLAEAQQPKKVPRIGYLSAFDAASESNRAEGVRLALRQLGYIEGQNIATEYRYAAGKRDRYPEFAAELVRLKVDIIVVAGGFIPIQAVKNGRFHGTYPPNYNEGTHLISRKGPTRLQVVAI